MALPVANYNATPSFLCKGPKEGLKYASFQVPTNQADTYYIDMGAGNPPPLSQFCSIYVDATELPFGEVTILVADSGYQFTIDAGNANFFPILTGTTQPKFFINRSIATGTPFFIKLFCFNQYIPDLSAQPFQNSLLYGIDVDGFGQIKIPAEVAAFTDHVSLTNTYQSITSGFINATLNGLQVNVIGLATVASVIKIITIGQADSVGTVSPIFQFPVEFTNVTRVIPVCNIDGLQFARGVFPADGHNDFYIKVNTVTNLTTADAYYNLQIGVNNSDR